MLATQLVVLATIAIVDGTRVSIQGNLATAKEQQEEQLAKTKDEAEEPTPTTRRQPPDISLEMAAKTGDVAALAQHGQAGSDLNEKLDSSGWTAAHYAARYGHAAALKVLHEAGANLSATTSSSQSGSRTPAYLAAKDGQAKALEALAKARADLQTAGEDGRTPTHAAASNCKVEALKVLIKAGVNINDTDFYGNTPADDAAGGEGADCYEALQLLVQAGGTSNAW